MLCLLPVLGLKCQARFQEDTGRKMDGKEAQEQAKIYVTCVVLGRIMNMTSYMSRKKKGK